MDPKRFKEAYQRLETLDDLMSYKIRPRPRTMSSVSVDQLEQQVHDLSRYNLEMKEIVRDLFRAIAAQPGSGTPKS